MSERDAAYPGPRAGARVDTGLTALVVGFAFLAASFVARNSDVWLHLAAGRLVATGGYTIGVDPFSSVTAGAYWADHSWLFDAGLYAGYTRLGGPALVALKALGVAALAGVMLRTARGPGPFWVAAGGVLLAVLAASPRLLLQPACLSLLLLAVCVQLLRAGGRGAWAALPVVVAGWANLDGWFVLGPVVVALFGLGGLLGGGRPADAPPPPWWLLPACLAACLLTPHHVRGLTLPAEVSPAVWASGLPDDPRLAPLFVSPWRLAAFGPAGGYSPAAYAYVVLLTLGAASFAANRRAVVGWRGLVWLAFAALSAWQARLVPFFAVVAGPIASLNVRDVLPRAALGRTGRTGAAAAALGLMLLAWPGWLQGVYARDRAAGWDVAPDPSLRRAAEDLARWRDRGDLPADARTFETHPDAAHYAAWFAPGGRTFLDSRLQLFTGVAADYRRLSAAVGAVPDPGDAAGADELLREHRVAAVVLADPDRRRFADELRHAVDTPDRWALVSVAGDAVVIAPKPGGRPAGRLAPFDPDRAAFGPEPPAAPPAPVGGPATLPQTPPWWEYFARRPRPDSWQAGAADVDLLLFAEGGGRPDRGPGGRSPALPLLAVRAARAAAAADPTAAAAWVVLARAYALLGQGTWEADGPGLPLLGSLRYAQAAAALHQAVTADPDSAPARDLLAGLFAARGYVDLALRHRAAELRLVTRAGPRPGEDAGRYADRVAALAAAVDQLETRVLDGENRFLVSASAAAGAPLARARLALQLGLAGRAQDVLVGSHPDLYGPDGLALLLRTLVETGQAEEARVLLDREELVRNPTVLGVFDLPGGTANGRPWGYRLPAYDWYDLCQAAGAGRYDRAARALDRLRGHLERDEAVLAPALRRGLAVVLGAEVGLAPVPPALARAPLARERDALVGQYLDARSLALRRADVTAVAGFLLIEQGRPAAADAEFGRAEALYPGAEPTAPGAAFLGTIERFRAAIRRARE